MPVQFNDLRNVIDGIRRYYPVSDRSLELFIPHLSKLVLPKQHMLTVPGRTDRNAYFIERGCSRTFLLLDDKEVTNWFSREGDFTFSSNSLYHQSPGFEYVELLEDSIIYSVPVSTLNSFYESNIEIANWGRVIHQEVLLRMQTLRLERMSLTAKERYQKFISENPDLINRVNLGQIASFLGMTQQHLSALRAE